MREVITMNELVETMESKQPVLPPHLFRKKVEYLNFKV